MIDEFPFVLRLSKHERFVSAESNVTPDPPFLPKIRKPYSVLQFSFGLRAWAVLFVVLRKAAGG
jgi:hypothetical protein